MGLTLCISTSKCINAFFGPKRPEKSISLSAVSEHLLTHIKSILRKVQMFGQTKKHVPVQSKYKDKNTLDIV
jgi:hypothetical protein